jgi:ferredoxin
MRALCAPVFFEAEEVTVFDAPPGAPLLRVASAAGVHIPTGCRSGSCGACEVELRVRYVADAAVPAGDTSFLDEEDGVVRACVTRTPTRPAALTISALCDDEVWGT